MSFLLSFHFWLIVGIIFLALLLAFLGAKLLKRGEDQAGSPDPVPEGPNYFDDIKAFIGKFGFFSIDSISQSFVHALKILRNHIGGSSTAYQLPWILVIGAKNSGKSSFINSLDLDQPMNGEETGEDIYASPLVHWNFYNHGLLIEADGSLILDAVSLQSNETDWRLLIDSFVKFRSKRPLDGIVVTIPYEEISTDSSYGLDDQLLRSESIYRKLWEVQRVTGMRLPIYLVVTKCDNIAGFDSLVKTIPAETLNSMLGWSNDRTLDAAYQSRWIDQAFDTILSGIYEAQQELYTQGLESSDRDGIFLFPLSLQKLKDGIQTWCDQLFKNSSYHESFFLRGIYFTGSSNEESVQIFGNAPNPVLDNIVFSTNLVENKIFREVGLARPVSGQLLGNTRALNIAKTGVAIGAVVSVLGLLKANENLKIANLNLLPTLQQIEVQLAEISSSFKNDSNQQLYFDSHTQVLLNTMAQIEVNSLFSLFIPSSWFSPLDSKIQRVMTIAYDQIIFQSLFRELNEKAKNLVSITSSSIGIQDNTVNSQNPLQSQEFLALQTYVNDIKAFENIADLYNSLSLSSSPADVAKIVKYLFDYNLPPSFLDDGDEYYSQALSQSQVQTFDFDLYKNSAVAKLQVMFESFEDVAFNTDIAVPGLSQLMKDLQRITNNDALGQNEVDTLRTLTQELNTTLNAINNPDLNWLDAATFEPGELYDLLIAGIISSKYFFDSEIAESLTVDAEKRFVEFEASLSSYSSPLVNGPLFEIESGNIISAPSSGAALFQGSLNIFFSEAFMSNLTPVLLVTVIPAGSILLWDATQLQQIINIIADYNSYLSSKSMTFPKNIQPLLNYTARQNLVQSITTMLANAQVLDATVSVTSTMNPEDALLSQVQNYRITRPLLEQIFQTLRTNQANAAVSQLKSVLTNQNYALLTNIDQIMEDDHPYAIKDNSFDWWNGESLGSLEAFSVDTLPDLKSYLNLQRERIRYLAKEFAEPVVEILTEINKDGMPANLPLVNKWNGIITAIDGYNRKAPNNSLTALETYIEDTLSGITLASCPILANQVNPTSYQGDYFSLILQNLQIELARQCHHLSNTTSSQSYDQLATFFNANLAGRFPFVDDPQGVAPDALPSNIQAFYDLMDQHGSTVSGSLQEANSLGVAGKRAAEFIKQMNDIRAFFGGFLVAKNPIQSPAFTLKVDFRVNKDREVLGNQLIDWNMNVDGNTIDFRNPMAVGFWTYGKPVSMNFQWAANSPLEPTSSSDNLAMNVNGSVVSFSYPGSWGLLRLLVTQRASLSDFNNLVDNTPTTLKFKIPVTPKGNVASNLASSQAEVFVRVTIQPIQDATQEQKLIAGQIKPGQSAAQLNPTTSVPLPTFPTLAPVLSNGGAQ